MRLTIKKRMITGLELMTTDLSLFFLPGISEDSYDARRNIISHGGNVGSFQSSQTAKLISSRYKNDMLYIINLP